MALANEHTSPYSSKRNRPAVWTCNRRIKFWARISKAGLENKDAQQKYRNQIGIKCEIYNIIQKIRHIYHKNETTNAKTNLLIRRYHTPSYISCPLFTITHSLHGRRTQSVWLSERRDTPSPASNSKHPQQTSSFFHHKSHQHSQSRPNSHLPSPPLPSA